MFRGFHAIEKYAIMIEDAESKGVKNDMETMAEALFQLFALMSIILPIAGGVLFLVILWRGMKALEGINQSLKVLATQKKGNEAESEELSHNHEVKGL